ncbi:MAG: CDP-diacylglycerol--serine O-phosphatidyltransferase [Nanobdellota archaeon]
MKIIRTMKLADLFTLGNFICGVLAIMFSFQNNFKTAGLLMVIAFIFDMLDGRVARLTKKANKFGKELDSLADLTSFGVAPAIFGFAQGLQNPVSIIILAFFASCGIIRLARFNVLSTKDFIGVPITINGLLFPIIYLLFGVFNNYILLIYLIIGILMISDFKVKKI